MQVIEICVKPGDSVVDDSIVVLESEKAAMDIPFKTGIVKKFLLELGRSSG